MASHSLYNTAATLSGRVSVKEEPGTGSRTMGQLGNASKTSHPPLHTPDHHIVRRSISTPSLTFPNILNLPPSSVPSAGSYLSDMTDITLYTPTGTPQSCASRAGGSRKFPPTFDSPTPHGTYNSAVRMDGIKGANAMEMGELSGIQPPATFPLSEYPAAFTRQDPVPTDEVEEPSYQGRQVGDGSSGKRPRQGAPSCNPWDYLVGDAVPDHILHNLAESRTRYGPDANHGCKVRRRFTKRELESLEVLWSIAKSPSKYERQRLGAWLGVKTKHITVWFQNRRQEEKRYTRDGQNENPPPSRSNRGTFDPVTGKWRPVPVSCISGLQPPPEDKTAVVRAISLGDVTRDMWLTRYPSSSGGGATAAARASPTPLGPAAINTGRTVNNAVAPVPVRNPSKSLDALLQERESGFGTGDKRYRRVEGEVGFKAEGQERNLEILALMPSDPPSMGLAEMGGEESDEDDGGIDEEAVRRRRARQAAVRPSLVGIGRATSYDVLASSTRAKFLAKPQPEQMSSRPHLTQLDPNTSFSQTGTKLRKHTLESVAQSQPFKRHRSLAGAQRNPSLHAKVRGDDFSRSVSTSAIPHSSRPSSRTENRGRSYQPSQLKTPNPGFTRSHSVSSGSSRVITPEEPKENRREVMNAGLGQKSLNEKDAEVLGAAEMLLQMFGGAGV